MRAEAQHKTGRSWALPNGVNAPVGSCVETTHRWLGANRLSLAKGERLAELRRFPQR